MKQNNRRRRARPARYGSLTSFYTADPRRVDSRERDVGLWWREAADGPLYRAAWVNDTGELYLVRLGPSEQGGGEVEVLATIAEPELLEQALAGWRERCGEPRSLGWLRRRAEQRSAAQASKRPLGQSRRPSAASTARSARLSASMLAPGIWLPAK